MRSTSFHISPSNHIYCDYEEQLAALDMEGDSHAITIKELVAAFKKKAYHMMPNKHQTLPNAHSRFEAMTSAFLKLLDHSLGLKDLTRSDLIPGIVNTGKCEILIPLKDDTAHLWRMAVAKTYKDIITEPREKKDISERRFSVIERRNSIASSIRSSGLRRRDGLCGVPVGVQEAIKTVQEGSNNNFALKRVSIIGKSSYKTIKDAVGQGVSYVVFWRCVEDFGEETFKINLTIYQKDILQVKGLSFLLWMLNCYHTMDSLVTLLKKHQEGEGQDYQDSARQQRGKKGKERRNSL